ncbi:hypothetical protein J6590_009772 [Homalodisca vitripennis]|nr:hypothetical protein J6590_009772 [Homalodisca vitripennis]
MPRIVVVDWENETGSIPGPISKGLCEETDSPSARANSRSRYRAWVHVDRFDENIAPRRATSYCVSGYRGVELRRGRDVRAQNSGETSVEHLRQLNHPRTY